MNMSGVLYREILPTVEKPSRYLGTELNTAHKSKDEVELRISLVFPDLYDLGLGNLGLLILYSILNERPWCWAERAYAPAPDMEQALRRRGLPMFTNESKDSLDEMDLIGFTFQSELTYTNIINMIDMAGLPVRAEDRDDSHPLVFGGGPAAFNPEPMAPFMDFFVIGDGEEAVVELAELYRSIIHAPRREKLEAIAQLEGFYVPELYPFETLEDGRVLPREDAPPIVKRLVPDLDAAAFPKQYIVPYTQQVHDRLALEVLRGCTQGCRFCQAGMVTRPVRERKLHNVDKLIGETLEKTGYEEVSLVSLSTCDFSRPRQLVRQAADRAHKDRVSVSLPSLRLDSFSVELADMVAGLRRSGLTFAPEAASPRLRQVINKWIPDEELLEMARETFQRGWEHVKCYFMIGLPTERDEDVEAIVDLCKRTLAVGRTVRSNARVNLGVSTFVPKPFTPFQWAEQISMEETERRQAILEEGFKRTGGIKFGRHESVTTFIEGLLSRADRRAADLIEAAWRRGARFESWGEQVNLGAWREAVEAVNYDVADAFRERDVNERLPWDHIDILIPKQWFQADWARAHELKHAPDCRQGKCHLCGVIHRERDLCRHMIKNQKQGRKEEADLVTTPAPQPPEPEPVQRLWFRIGRAGEARFLSHLELVNAWIRALRRAKAPLSYSQGYHAHPKVKFATAPPVGEESMGDYMDIVLKERVEPDELLSRLQATLPEGFFAYNAKEVPLKAPSLMSSARGFAYTFEAAADPKALQARIEALLSQGAIEVERKAKQAKKKKRHRHNKQYRPESGMVKINVRPMIRDIRLSKREGDHVTVDVDTIVQESGACVRTAELLRLLELDPVATRVIKRDTFLDEAALTAIEPAGV